MTIYYRVLLAVSIVGLAICAVGIPFATVLWILE